MNIKYLPDFKEHQIYIDLFKQKLNLKSESGEYTFLYWNDNLYINYHIDGYSFIKGRYEAIFYKDKIVLENKIVLDFINNPYVGQKSSYKIYTLEKNKSYLQNNIIKFDISLKENCYIGRGIERNLPLEYFKSLDYA